MVEPIPQGARTASPHLVTEGAAEAMPVANTFWGDRYGRLEDPFGHVLAVATHVKDMTPDEIAKAAKAAFGG